MPLRREGASPSSDADGFDFLAIEASIDFHSLCWLGE